MSVLPWRPAQSEEGCEFGKSDTVSSTATVLVFRFYRFGHEKEVKNMSFDKEFHKIFMMFDKRGG